MEIFDPFFGEVRLLYNFLLHFKVYMQNLIFSISNLAYSTQFVCNLYHAEALYFSMYFQNRFYKF